MTAMVASASSPLTVHDLEGMPDDGRRYELLDGVLLVTPAPGWPHQEMALSLAVLLRQACPADLRVLIAPFAIRPDGYTELQPDLLVARYHDLTLKNLPVAPVLAVEVLSRSTRMVDLNLKRAAFARLGVASYWLLDPEPRAPSVTALELSNGEYQEVVCAVGDEEFIAQRPFPMRLRPADLLAGLRPSPGALGDLGRALEMCALATRKLIEMRFGVKLGQARYRYRRRTESVPGVAGHASAEAVASLSVSE